MKLLNVALFIAFLLFSEFSFAQSDEVYIDVRTWGESQVSRIDGDTRIHVSDIVDGVSQQFPSKDTPISLYCKSGVRAETALQKLKAAGYLNVKNVGGIDEVRKSRFGEASDD